MSITSVFSLVGLLAALGLGTVTLPAVGGSLVRGTGLASSLPDGALAAKAVRRPLDTVGGTPAH